MIYLQYNGFEDSDEEICTECDLQIEDCECDLDEDDPPTLRDTGYDDPPSLR